jgi:hypothetical protein
MPPERPERDERLLVVLQLKVTSARADVQKGRSSPPSPYAASDQQRRCERLLGALEEYADAASTAGVPLPYRYRDEMRLYKSVYPGIGRRITSQRDESA